MSTGQALFLIFKLVCYAALALVGASLAIIVVFSLTGACSSLTSGGVQCSSSGITALAEAALGMLLLAVFTGLPGLLALVGAGILVRAIYLNMGAGAPQSAPVPHPMDDAAQADDAVANPPAHKPRSAGMTILKIIGAFLGIALLAGIVAGIMGW